MNPSRSGSLLFQSTPPRGGRHWRQRHKTSYCYFNPRPREGGDVDKLLSDMRKIISIHAPARGATTPALHIHFQTVISIHAPREGGDFVRTLDAS